MNNFFTKLIDKKFHSKFYFEKDNSFNGKKNLNIIINATKKFCTKNKIYVEIGVFRGFTLFNNALNNKNIQCIGVDNFSLFDEDKKNLKKINKTILRYKIKNIKIIKKDFEEAQKIIKKKIGVLLIDGPHDYRSQLIALMKYDNLMSDNSIIIIDDSNYYHVRKATQDFLETHNNYSLVFQKYTKKHIANEKKNKNFYLDGYWNGINVLYKSSKNKFKKKLIMPKNEILFKELFFKSHDMFRHYYSLNGPEILDLIYYYKKKKMSKEKFLQKVNKIKIPYKLKKQIKYRSQNIF